MSRRVSGQPGLTAVEDQTLVAVLYTRVSRDRSRRRKSVTEQDAEGREVAHRERWHIPDDAVFTDNHRSASRFATKPRVGWDAVLAYLSTNPVHVLILWEVSRGDRRLGPWVALLDLCRERKILIHIVKDEETYDPTNSRDRKYLAQEGIEAEEESERTSKRIQRDKRAAALDGRPAGRLNYGYRRVYDERGHYVETVLHEHQASVKADVIDAGIIEGRPLLAIEHDLNGRRETARREAWRQARRIAATGQPWEDRWADVRKIVRHGQRWDSPEGGAWRTTAIRRLALNPVYAGKRVHQGRIVGEGRWPVITPDDRLNLITSILTDPARRKQDGTRLRYQLAAAAVCGREGCGGLIRVAHRAEYRCVQCQRCSMNMAVADRVINSMMSARLQQPDAQATFVPPDTDDALAAAEDGVRVLRNRLDDHYRESAAGRLTARGLGIVEADLIPQIEAAEARVKELSRPSALRGVDPVELARTWPDQPVTLRRDVIVALAEVRISSFGKGKRSNAWRLAESRWRGDALTWGEHWRLAGAAPV